eukprot:1156511-Pelagomonas_calceolata.AAC.6
MVQIPDLYGIAPPWCKFRTYTELHCPLVHTIVMVGYRHMLGRLSSEPDPGKQHNVGYCLEQLGGHLRWQCIEPQMHQYGDQPLSRVV